MYRGSRCRELSLQTPIPSNRDELKAAKRLVEIAADKLATIRLEIELGSFRYGNHFPDSPRCKVFGEGTRDRTIEQSLRAHIDAVEDKTEYSTWISYKRIADYQLCPRIGAKLVSTFTAQDTADLILAFGKEGRVGKTVRNIMLVLRGAFDREVKAETIKVNPVRSVTVNAELPVASRKHRVPLPQPYNAAERAAIIKFAHAQIVNLCETWWGTGMAEGEILGLCWPDLDFVGKTIHLQRVLDTRGDLRPRMKTEGRQRILEMTPTVEAALIRQKQFSFIEGKEVFQNPATGEPWSRGKAITHNQWPTLLKRAGVVYRGPNQCRHTYASIRITAGDNLWLIAEALGHRSPEMLYKHYGKIIRERDDHPAGAGMSGRRAG